MIAIDKTAEPVATWYQTKSWRWTITPTKVLKISAKQLVVISEYNGRPSTTAKVSRNTIYWPTRDEAVNYLRERLERKREELAMAEADFAKIEGATNG